MNDVITGRVPLMFGSAANVLPHVQAGTLKALAATQSHADRRRTACPDHAVESGLPGYDAVVWMGLLAPAGTPRETIDRLSQAANEALRAKEVRDRAAGPGLRDHRQHARGVRRPHRGRIEEMGRGRRRAAGLRK